MEVLSTVRSRLKEAVDRLAPQALLLSGGVDSGLLSCLRPDLEGIAVSLEGRGGDGPFLEVLRGHLGVRVQVVEVTVGEALRAIPEVVRVLQSFDPALPNDLAVYFGLRAARQKGLLRVATGDGGDELFGGYPYMLELADLEGYIRRIVPHLRFSSQVLGEAFGVEVLQPYLEPDFVSWALRLPGDLKVRREGGKLWGKWALRKALELDLPPEFAWQGKRPLEVGSGMVALREVIAKGIGDREFREKGRAYGMRFLSKEHLYFYEVFREVVGEVPPPKGGEVPCPNCGAGVLPGGRHCRTCGMVLR